MARRKVDDFDVHPEEDIEEPLEEKRETKRELELRKLKEQIKSLELKNKSLELKNDKPIKIIPKKKRSGAPEKYSKEFHPKLAKLFYSQGGIDREFAEYIGITEPTIHAWKKKHKEFREAIRSGKLDPDTKVEAALYSSAVNDGSNTAQIFWLKNRQPEKWRDKQDLNISGSLEAKKTFTIVDKDGNELPPEAITSNK